VLNAPGYGVDDALGDGESDGELEPDGEALAVADGDDVGTALCVGIDVGDSLVPGTGTAVAVAVGEGLASGAVATGARIARISCSNVVSSAWI